MKIKLNRAVIILGLLIPYLLFFGCPTEPPPSTKAQLVIDTTALSDSFKGRVYSFTLDGSAGEEASYAWTISSGSLPAGLSLSSEGVITGTPTVGGTFNMTISLDDGVNTTGTKALSLFVDEISITTGSSFSAQKDTAFSETLAASNGTAPYTYSIASGTLPTGLSLAADAITGTPTVFGLSTFTVHVVDSTGAFQDKEISMSVISGLPVSITTSSLSNTYSGGTYSATLSATGGQGAYTWARISGSLPSGLSLNTSTGVISGTATTAGTYTFEVRATDTVETANSATIEFTIITRSSVNITTTTLAATYEGASYSVTLAATGGSGSGTWTVSTGSLPGGLSLNASSGVLSGTPSANGTFSFSVTKSDNETSANSDVQSLSLTVYDGVAITTSSLSDIQASTSMSVTLGKSGGTGTYSWSLQSGSLPLDTTMSTAGVISGYPSKPGTYNFTIRCADQTYSGNYDDQAYVLNVTELDWTIMVYLDGDNNLETNAFNDINEMEAADLRGKGIKVIVLMDGISGYYVGTDNFTDTRLYEVAYQGTSDLTSTGIYSRQLASTQLGLTTTSAEELNMASPATATSFIDFCQAEYPADKYAFVFWDHGDGWRTADDVKTFKSVVSDDTSGGDTISTKEVGTIVAGRGIDVIGFDACLMGMVEVAYEIKDDASYMVGSAELEPGDGWEYDTLFNNFAAKTDRSAREFALSVVSAYSSRYIGTSGTTLSALDLSKIDSLKMALDTFNTSLSSATFSTVYNAVTSTSLQRYNGDGVNTHVDLYDFAYLLSSLSGSSALRVAIDNTVIANYHYGSTHLDAHGIAIYLPNDGAYMDYFSPFYNDSVTDFTNGSEWDEWLHTFWWNGDLNEPNDGVTSSTSLFNGIARTGYIASAIDWDMYRIYVSANGTFNVTLTVNSAANLNAALVLYHSSDLETPIDVMNDYGAGSGEGFTFDTLASGVGTGYYYVLVTSTSTTSYDRNYTYSITATAGTATLN